MRVITGKYKGRRFDVPRTFKARPTTDFAKESLFNVLLGYIDFDEGPVALDLFAGTGSITLELLSRGCSRVVSVEKDPLHYNFICKFIEKLQDTAAIPIRGDVFKYLEKCRDKFDFIFADPPYTLSELNQLPDLIMGHGLLKKDGLFVLEHGKVNDFTQHPNFVEHRAYGSVNFSFFKTSEA
ncbi:MAG: RsmD family RNA methyltransferase [Bacteroidaceae bacterium]|nr:RsmD family RNA methyltransferase [Bacteroidaceae bacterium]